MEKLVEVKKGLFLNPSTIESISINESTASIVTTSGSTYTVASSEAEALLPKAKEEKAKKAE